MAMTDIPLAKELDRVPSSIVPLTAAEESRFRGIMEEAVMVDMHQHPFVLPESMDQFVEYLRTNRY